MLGAAPAEQLHRISFADTLIEETGTGYQRPFDPRHSRDFRAYIETAGATTIPLTFNLRGRERVDWWLENTGAIAPELVVVVPEPGQRGPLAQVDCQHRLGMMSASSLVLTFQCFLGLSPTEEMQVFNVINGKAKGLSSALLDYHATKLIAELPRENLDLYIAKKLHDDPASVWHGQIKLGGATTQGGYRRVSLRGMQAAVKLLLHRCPLPALTAITVEAKYDVVRSFWSAVSDVWPSAWKDPRRHLLTKGVGVNALSLLAGDLITMLIRDELPGVEAFTRVLAPLGDVDWGNHGAFKGFGGRRGASEAHQFLTGRLFRPRVATGSGA